MTNYVHLHLSDVSKVEITRTEFGIRIRLFEEENLSCQSITIHGPKDFVQVVDKTIPEAEPMIAP